VYELARYWISFGTPRRASSRTASWKLNEALEALVYLRGPAVGAPMIACSARVSRLYMNYDSIDSSCFKLQACMVTRHDMQKKGHSTQFKFASLFLLVRTWLDRHAAEAAESVRLKTQGCEFEETCEILRRIIQYTTYCKLFGTFASPSGRHFAGNYGYVLCLLTIHSSRPACLREDGHMTLTTLIGGKGPALR
jgi:hypothetical protein